MRLPPELRLSLLDRIDRRLAVIVGASIVTHLAIAVWAWQADLDQPVLGTPNLPVASVTQDTYDVTIPDPAPTRPAVASPVSPVQVPARIVAPVHVQRPGTDDALRMASLLTDETPGPHGAGAMATRQPGADLARQIDEARTHTITIGDRGHTSRVDDSAHIHDGLPAPTVQLPGRLETAPRHDEVPVRLRISDTHVDQPTSLDADTVLAKIQGAYMGGLQRCYRLGLAHEASLAGRVQVSFTIDDRGHVADPAAQGVSQDVDGCIQNVMSAWRFQVPKDRDGNATDMSFRAILVLAL